MERNNVTHVHIHFTGIEKGWGARSHLPDSDNSISNEDQKNDNRLNKGSGRLLSLLKQGQHLDDHKGTHRDILYNESPQVPEELTHIHFQEQHETCGQRNRS